METKSSLRRRLSDARQQLPASERHAFDVRIEEKLHWLINWQASLTVHIYSANTNWHEVSTVHFMEYLRSAAPLTQLYTSKPDKGAAIPSEKFDVIVVPLLGFDEACQRLGMGGGWYDRFLATQPQALKVGLAYECQKLELVPTKPHDQPLDVVLTEVRIYRS